MKKFGLNRNIRLKKHKEISHVFNQGMIQNSSFIKLFYISNELSFSRFAIVINKRYGNAVQRNKAKRAIRELFRLNKKDIPKGWDMVFFLKNEFQNSKFDEKQKCFQEIIKKLI